MRKLTLRAGTRGRAALEALAPHPGGLSTPQCAQKTGEQPSPKTLSVLGEVLRSAEDAGWVRRGGWTPGAQRKGPAVIWLITAEGQAVLDAARRPPAEPEPAPRRKRGRPPAPPEAWAGWAGDPTAAAALRTLHEDLGLAIILANTHPHETRRPARQKAGIDDLFSVVLLSYPLGVRKPDPLFYRLILSAAEVPPGQVLFVGDVTAPLAHAMQSALVRPQWLRPGETLLGGALLVQHVTELPALLEAG